MKSRNFGFFRALLKKGPFGPHPHPHPHGWCLPAGGRAAAGVGESYSTKNNKVRPPHHQTPFRPCNVSASASTIRGLVAGTTDSQAVTNKTLTDSTNNTMAKSLKSAATTIDASSGTPSATGQVLTATRSKAANWSTLNQHQTQIFILKIDIVFLCNTVHTMKIL